MSDHGSCEYVDCDVVICFSDEEWIDNPRKQIPGRIVTKARKLVIDVANDYYRKSPHRKRLRILANLPCSYNGRLTAKIGLCKTRPSTNVNRMEALLGLVDYMVEPVAIEITSKFKLSEEDLFETLVHEFCHAANACVTMNYGSFAHGHSEHDGHGKEWRDLMIACGLPANSVCDVEAKPELKAQLVAHHDKRRKKIESERTRIRQARRGSGGEISVGQTVWFFGPYGYLFRCKVMKINRDTVSVKVVDAPKDRYIGSQWRVQREALATRHP